MPTESQPHDARPDAVDAAPADPAWGEVRRRAAQDLARFAGDLRAGGRRQLWAAFAAEAAGGLTGAEFGSDPTWPLNAVTVENVALAAGRVADAMLAEYDRRFAPAAPTEV